MKIGVVGDCFKMSVADDIKAAAGLYLDGIQIYATDGEFCPENLNEEKIAFYKKLLADNKLEISALCGDLGGCGFERQEENAQRIAKTKDIIDLAVKLGTSVVTTHIGVIPSDRENERYNVMLSALRECGDYAAQKGVTLAIETGPETADVLNGFVREAGDGVGVNLDPANFVMVTGQDPAAAVRLLREKIVHTHLKDGKMLKKSDPEIIYGHFATGGIEALNVADFFIETPVGEGDVDWSDYISSLREIGFDGYLTIERETGADPAADIKKAVDFARKNNWID